MVSLKDIAANCGVSVATVSKALNGHSDIGIDTKNRICEMAKKMGYMPNTAARALKTRRTYNIGIMLEDEAHSGLTHDYFAHILESFRSTAEQKGYDITLVNNNRLGATYYEKCRSHNFDGVLVVCVDFDAPQVRELTDSSIPVVTIDHRSEHCSAVLSDNYNDMKKLVEYVIKKGHRKIAYIHGNPSGVTEERLKSFHDTLKEHDITVPAQYIKEGYYVDAKRAGSLTHELLSLPDRPTCILYTDDLSCFGGMNVIQNCGLRIPDDISVTGYDGNRLSEVISPRITTIRQDTEKIGVTAAECLIRMIEQPKQTPLETIIIAGELLEGESVMNKKD